MKDCIFCKILNDEIPSKRLYEDDKVIVIMDVNPVVDGHCLIIPKEHIEDYISMPNELLGHIFDVARDVGKKIMKKLNSKGLTLTINYGESQVVKHFHLHLLPDYNIKEKTMNIEEVFELLKEDSK